MKINFILGSPKAKKSASRVIMQYLMERLGTDVKMTVFNAFDARENLSSLADCDALVFVSPLYLDALPGYVLRLMEEIEKKKDMFSENTRLYAVINSGFYEAKQGEIALEIMKHFGDDIGLNWGQGVCIGAGSALEHFPLIGKGPLTKIGQGLKQMAQNIAQGISAEDQKCSVGFPRSFYVSSAHQLWKKEAAKNGISPEALRAQLSRT